MSFREWLARKISPALAHEADCGRKMRCEMEHDRQWLAEFPAIFDELSRLIDMDRCYRGFQWPEMRLRSGQILHSHYISDFRDYLRRERDSTTKSA